MIWLGISIIIASIIVYTGLYNIAEALEEKKNVKIIEKRGR